MSEIEEKIVDLIKERKLDKDTAISCIICLQGNQKNCEEFYDWLLKSESATRDDVWEKVINY